MNTTTCSSCGAAFDFFPITIHNKPITPNFCEKCATADCDRIRKRTIEAARSLERQRQWERICSPYFRDSIPSRLPCQSESLRVLKRPVEGRRGCVLWGSPRLGKSRTLFLFLAKCFDGGRRICAFDSLRFHEEYEQCQGRFDTTALTKRLSSVDILAFDDVDKVKLPRSAGDKLFAIFSRRCDAGLPTFFTCNANGAGLESVLPHPKPFVSRIREFCDAVHFGHENA